MAEASRLPIDHRFNDAANDSPRSGSSKRATPIVLGIVTFAIVALTIWFAFGS